MTIKCLDVPRSFGGKYCNQPQPHLTILAPVFGRDGWYRWPEFCSIEWIEYQGKVYEPIGSYTLLEKLGRLTIEEKPLRDCEYKFFQRILRRRSYHLRPALKADLFAVVEAEKLRRSLRQAYASVRLRTFQIRKEQRSQSREGLDRAVDDWIKNIGENNA